MPVLYQNVYSAGLGTLTTNGTRVDICSTEPTTYAQATSTYTLGYKATTTGSIASGSPSGYKVTVSALSGASVTGTATAAYWALTDGSANLYATGSLSASQAVTSGNTFSLAAFDIRLPAVGGA
jgi:hypothetical protein